MKIQKTTFIVIVLVAGILVATIGLFGSCGRRTHALKNYNGENVSTLVIEIKVRSRIIAVNIDNMDYDDAIKSLMAGLGEIDDASDKGKMLAWAPIGIMKIDGKSYPWYTHSSDLIVKKYISKYYTDE